MNVQTKKFDQFFTKNEISEKCVNKTLGIFDKIQHDLSDVLFIEPSAGLGCFFYSIKEKELPIKAYDIDPKRKYIKKNNFLRQRIKINRKKENPIIIGNPPFGKNGKMALEFIKKSFEYTDFVCFILPNNFQKYSMQRLLSDEVKIIFQEQLPKNSFYILENRKEKTIDIGCVFQILTIKDLNVKDLRIRQRPPITHKDFILYQYNNTKPALKYFKEDFDIAIFNQGYGKYPTIKTRAKDCNKKKQWLLVKARNKNIISKIKKMDFEKLANKNTTVKGFRKADFVAEYKKLYG